LQEIIRRYHETGFDLAVGASLPAIQTAQLELDCIFPEELRVLYQDHNGMAASGGAIPFRLLSLEEVVDFHKVVRDYGWVDLGVRVFWTDDNSNYAGLYVSGPLIGKVCVIDHEEPDLSPAYASLPSFLTTLLAVIPEEVEWYDLPQDYPAVGPASDPQAMAADWQLVQSLQSLYEASQDEERMYYAYCRMALTPFEHTNTLLPFTYDEDMYVQARACEILGLRRYEPATGRLTEVVQHGMHNGRWVAIHALGRIGTTAARANLQALLTADLPWDYRTDIQRVLRIMR